MSKFYNNPINDKQMRANSKTANNIVQIASDAQKVINNSVVSMVRYIGEFDHTTKTGQEGDCISEPNGDIYLMCNGQWVIIGNNTYNYNYYSGGRSNGKTMKTAAMQAAKAEMTNTSDEINLFANWHALAHKASAALERNKGIRIFCSESQIYKDLLPSGMNGGYAAPPSSADMNIKCTLKTYTFIGEDLDYGKSTAEVKFKGSDFEDGSYIDKEISIPPTLSKEDRYVLRIAYVFRQVDKLLKGQADPSKPPKFSLQIHYEY